MGLVRSSADHIVRKTTELYSVDRRWYRSPSPYVSRGAFKLKKALDKFAPVVKGKKAMDVGASTGGFTDLLLSYDAKEFMLSIQEQINFTQAEVIAESFVEKILMLEIS